MILKYKKYKYLIFKINYECIIYNNIIKKMPQNFLIKKHTLIII